MANQHKPKPLRLNCSTDACHLNGSTNTGVLHDIIQPLAGGDILLDTFSVDSQNESQDSLAFLLSCDKKASLDQEYIQYVQIDLKVYLQLLI